MKQSCQDSTQKIGRPYYHGNPEPSPQRPNRKSHHRTTTPTKPNRQKLEADSR
jgi:hypothetical protein